MCVFTRMNTMNSFQFRNVFTLPSERYKAKYFRRLLYADTGITSIAKAIIRKKLIFDTFTHAILVSKRAPQNWSRNRNSRVKHAKNNFSTADTHSSLTEHHKAPVEEDKELNEQMVCVWVRLNTRTRIHKKWRTDSQLKTKQLPNLWEGKRAAKGDVLKLRKCWKVAKMLIYYSHRLRKMCAADLKVYSYAVNVPCKKMKPRGNMASVNTICRSGLHAQLRLYGSFVE